MLSKPATNQVIKAIELGMTAEDIAVDLGYDVILVKQIMAKRADELNRGLMVSDPLNPVPLSQQEVVKPVFTEDETETAKNAVMELVRGAEVESVKLKAAEFVINESKGRHDVMKKMADQNFNIEAINLAMKRARLSMELTRAKQREAAEKAKSIEV